MDAATILPDLPARLAQMQAEFEEKRAGEDFDMEALREKANSRGRASVEDGEAEGKSKAKARGRRATKAVDAPEQLSEGIVPDDIAAGAEDQQPPQRRRGRPPKK